MKNKYFLIAVMFLTGMGAGMAQLKDILIFNNSNGSWPEGNLSLIGGKLYGMTPRGGLHNTGRVFGIDTTGTGYVNVLDYYGGVGAEGLGSFVTKGNRLYGMTHGGGIYADGNAYAINTDGTGYKDLIDWYYDQNPMGSNPYGTMTLSGAKLFGMTYSGGALPGYGTIFTVDTDGTGFKMLYNFGVTDGEAPLGDLTLVGPKLYGMTMTGGAHNSGVIFAIDSTGNNYKVILNFDTANGLQPYGSLIWWGGKLWGMTEYGGSHTFGLIFSIDTNGGRFRDIFDFGGANGKYPLGNVTFSGNVIYGVTHMGGASNDGCIFSVDTNGTNEKVLCSFNGANGKYPYGSLTMVGNKMYGTTIWGGDRDSGVVFSFKPTCNNYNEPICIATIDTATNKAEVIWGRTNSPPATGSYNVYRDSASGYTMTHSQPLTALSEYIDMNSNPTAGTVAFEISTVDSCGESILSPPHRTIYLNTTASTNVFILNWTPYIGFTPTVYRIFRGPALNAMVQIDSVAPTVYTYHDTLPPLGSYYAVEAVNPSGVCIPTTKIKPRNSMATLSGSFSNGFNTAVLGVQNIANSISNVTIYPNPEKGAFNIEWTMGNGFSAGGEISIINQLGQVVYSEHKQFNNGINKEQINPGMLASGIYSLRIQDTKGTTVKKLEVIK